MKCTIGKIVPALAIAAAIAGSARSAPAQTGACCLPPTPPALTTQPCIQTDAGTCAGMGGTYLGDNTECTAPNYAAPSSCDSIQIGLGQNGAPNGGQVNITGATLFKNFFTVPASTNADCLPPSGGPANGATAPNNSPTCSNFVPFCGFFSAPCPGFGATNQLAPTYACPQVTPYYWLVQYRGVGSVEGLIEFVDNQLLGIVPTAVPSDSGFINRLQFANLGAWSAIGACARASTTGAAPTQATQSGTPVIPHSMDMNVTDVPTTFQIQGSGTTADAKWNRKPQQAGYGKNTRTSSSGESNLLTTLSRGPQSLNLNTGAPDGDTLFQSRVAWSPIAVIANRGTGMQDIRYTELQYLQVTGRLPTGENMIVATRDVGSGTRNGFNNSIGVDPSQGVGENLGPRINNAKQANVGRVPVPAGGEVLELPLGSRTQASNCGGAGVMDNAVRYRRLAIGYQGLFGRAAGNQRNGLYEILNVAKDVDDNGDAIPGFVPAAQPADAVAGCPSPNANQRPANGGFVRAGVATVLDNLDPTKGYQIGGDETFVTRGDPKAGLDGNTNPAMANTHARDYIRNIEFSIDNFVAVPAADANNNMPGQFLAFNFALERAVDALPDLTNPTRFLTNGSLVQSLQDFSRCNAVSTNTPTAFGAANVAGQIPLRNSLAGLAGSPTYSDANVNGSYFNQTRSAYTAIANQRLNRRNLISGDFNGDSARNLNDIGLLMQAINNPATYQAGQGISVGTGGGDGPCADDYVIPEIIGDFDGDGDFSSLDVRYFADGLGIDPATGKLDRKKAFIAVDMAWNSAPISLGNNYFGTILATGTAHKPGDSRGDVAGSAQGPYRGAYPNGQDGVVNCKDIDYVYANFGNWANIDQASKIDLSADMTGDLIVDQRDVDELVFAILCTRYGDVNLDGRVDAADRAIVLANQGQNGLGWCGGDLNGDGVVDAADLTIVDANLGFVGPSCAATLCGDINGDAVVNNLDVPLFVQAVLAQTNNAAYLGRSDLNSNPPANGGDIQRFVCCLLNSGSVSSCP